MILPSKERGAEMGKCWCGKTHPRGDARNGEVKHWVMNWKLYQLRHRDGKEQEDGAHPGKVPGVIPVA